jgi:hypothetical protein
MTTLTSLSNEEILQNVYNNKLYCSALEIELARRLEYYINTFGSYLQEESWLEPLKVESKML